MAFMAIPEHYRRRLRSTNTVECLNEEIRRRERVIRIFPNVSLFKNVLGNDPVYPVEALFHSLASEELELEMETAG